MPECKIYFVRHGESLANVKGVFAGQKDDTPLTEKGRQQAKQTAASIKSRGIRVTKIISSPLKRAKETAEIIRREAAIEEAEIIFDERVSEYDMGSLTGKPFSNLTSEEMTSVEGAEDPEAFSERIHNLLAELKNIEGHVLIVSHAGVGRAIVGKKMGLKPNLFYDLKPLGNAEIMELS